MNIDLHRGIWIYDKVDGRMLRFYKECIKLLSKKYVVVKKIKKFFQRPCYVFLGVEIKLIFAAS